MPDYNVKELNQEIDFDQLPYWDVVVIGAGPQITIIPDDRYEQEWTLAACGELSRAA